VLNRHVCYCIVVEFLVGLHPHALGGDLALLSQYNVLDLSRHAGIGGVFFFQYPSQVWSCFSILFSNPSVTIRRLVVCGIIICFRLPVNYIT